MIKKPFSLIALPVLSTLLLLGCASAPKAPLGPDGQKIAVEVVVDGGYDQIDASNPNHIDQRDQLVNYMKTTTVKQLSGSGYEAGLQDSAKGPKEGARVLQLKIDNYNPGSAAARFFFGGFGGGAATLDVTATYKDGSKVLMTTSKSFASGRDWRKIVKKINVQVMREMAQHGKG